MLYEKDKVNGKENGSFRTAANALTEIRAVKVNCFRPARDNRRQKRTLRCFVGNQIVFACSLFAKETPTVFRMFADYFHTTIVKVI